MTLQQEMEELKKQVMCDIKSLLLASKEGLTEKELKREYFNLLGHPIPVNQLGFRNCNEMLNKMRDSIETKIGISDVGYLKVYFAKPDQATSDLVKLV